MYMKWQDTSGLHRVELEIVNDDASSLSKDQKRDRRYMARTSTLDIVYILKLQHVRNLSHSVPLIEFLPVSPDDITFVLLHKLTRGIFALDMCPCAGEMQDELAWLPLALFILEAGYVLWKSV